MDEEKKDRLLISRRSFIKGGVITTATISSGILGPPKGEAHVPEILEGVRRAPIRLVVNGKRYRLEVESRWTLAQVIRDELGLTGTKVCCDRGECGACTVLLDGWPVYSCSILAVEMDGRKIETIEALSKGDKLHPIQKAFIEYDAAQCGYCTPGQIMSLKALFDRNPKPTMEEIKRAVSGNLCRCGTYLDIFRAAEAVAKGLI